MKPCNEEKSEELEWAVQSKQTLHKKFKSCVLGRNENQDSRNTG